ncbi:MAG: glycoside hydrolase family 28 protein, partial [Clostridia bacterium]|nr:glycoside hydrolase family 28 protein [Clostridia bacterium]
RVGSCGDVTFSDVVMKNVKVPFVINMYYNMGDETGHTEYVWSTEKLPVDERTPQIGSFVFKNMVCTGVEYSAAAFYGLPESPIKSIAFDHVSFTYNEQAEAGFPDMREHNEAVKNQGLDFRNVQKVMLKNVVISGQSGEPVLTQNVKKITVI